MVQATKRLEIINVRAWQFHFSLKNQKQERKEPKLVIQISKNTQLNVKNELAELS